MYTSEIFVKSPFKIAFNTDCYYLRNMVILMENFRNYSFEAYTNYMQDNSFEVTHLKC